MEILVTGAAGFIGFHLCKRLLNEGFKVSGIDCLLAQDALSQKLYSLRLLELRDYEHFQFFRMDIRDSEKLSSLFQQSNFSQVIHLAAKTGVRDSFSSTQEYFSVNLEGSSRIVEECKKNRVEHLIFASSSSVYGEKKGPMSEKDFPEPASPYGQTKLALEKMAQAHDDSPLRTTGLRPFSVYGPLGRPDMAYFRFAESIAEGRPIILFNHGNHLRDFTYVGDVVEGFVRVVRHHFENRLNYSFGIFNLGRGKPEPTQKLVLCLEERMSKSAIIHFGERQKGDVGQTWADCSAFEREFKFRPQIEIEGGIKLFYDWWGDFLRICRSGTTLPL